MNHNSHSSKLYLYSIVERMNHWGQAALIILMILTGFEINGAVSLLGFGAAVKFHTLTAWIWTGLFAVIILRLTVTGEWRHYIPKFEMTPKVIRYYLLGIFKDEPHPTQRSEEVKHNPLQCMTYLVLVVVLLPFQIATGLIYHYHQAWESWGFINLNLSTVAFLHVASGFAILTFLIVHVYMITTGHSVTSHLKTMLTGWEAVPTRREE
jgi:thiosulfate reductase cytochrome b subunit